jgi:hypothetical protein
VNRRGPSALTGRAPLPDRSHRVPYKVFRCLGTPGSGDHHVWILASVISCHRAGAGLHYSRWNSSSGVDPWSLTGGRSSHGSGWLPGVHFGVRQPTRGGSIPVAHATNYRFLTRGPRDPVSAHGSPLQNNAVMLCLAAYAHGPTCRRQPLGYTTARSESTGVLKATHRSHSVNNGAPSTPEYLALGRRHGVPGSHGTERDRMGRVRRSAPRRRV